MTQITLASIANGDSEHTALAAQRTRRHHWEDCIIEAEVLDVLPTGTIEVAFRLMRHFTWAPKAPHKPAGLYWPLYKCAAATGIDLPVIEDTMTELTRAGYLRRSASGNYLPVIPLTAVDIRVRYGHRLDAINGKRNVDIDPNN